VQLEALPQIHYGLVPLKLAPALRESAAEWPVDELFLVNHCALRCASWLEGLWPNRRLKSRENCDACLNPTL